MELFEISDDRNAMVLGRKRKPETNKILMSEERHKRLHDLAKVLNEGEDVDIHWSTGNIHPLFAEDIIALGDILHRSESGDGEDLTWTAEKEKAYYDELNRA